MLNILPKMGQKLFFFLKLDKHWLAFATLLIPLISVFHLLQPMMLKQAIDQGLEKGMEDGLKEAAAWFLLFVICEYITRISQQISTTICTQRLVKNTRKALIRKSLLLPASFHDQNMSGAIVTRMTNDCETLSESLTQGVLQSFIDIFVLVGCVIGLISLHPKLAMYTLLFLPLSWLIMKWFGKELKAANTEARRHLGLLNVFAQETILGIETIKVLQGEKAANQKYAEGTEAFRKSQMRVVFFDAFLYSLLDGITTITLGLILWFATSHFKLITDLTPGIMVAYIRYLQQLFEPLMQLGNTTAQWQNAKTATEKIFELLDEKDPSLGKIGLINPKGSLRFEKVSFQYEPAKKSSSPSPIILKNIDFHLTEGQTLALVGPTGSGKSTTLKLIAKSYQGYSGRILIDQTELGDISQDSLRKNVAIVPQQVVIFKGSIAFNISLNREGITQKDIVEAAKLVNAAKFIEHLEGQYDFEVQEQGSNLSQGEKQLLVFARALVVKPKILILDEATASLDKETEEVIQLAIQKMLNAFTVIVVAHRLSTIQQANQILVLEKGEIKERGTHKELVQQQGLYAKLWGAT